MDFGKNKLAKFGIALLCILILSTSASALEQAFTVDEPDGTNDSTSAYYTIQWTPQYGGVGIDANMSKGVNTISCYASGSSSGYETGSNLFIGVACCDSNSYRLNLADLGGRGADAGYYIWCINDQNTDMNAYSGGLVTITRFKTADIGLLVIDSVGGIIGGVVLNASSLGVIFAVIIMMVFLFDAITGVFGLIEMFRGLFRRR